MRKKPGVKTEVLFASAIPDHMDRDRTLPARFLRLLDKLEILPRIKGRTVAIKMHLGGDLGYSTIHPLFVRLLVDHLKKGAPRGIMIMDGSIKNADMRGYSKETSGAPLVSTIGPEGKDVVLKKTGWKLMPEIWLGKPFLKADVLINFSHLKAHGDAGFGGACKNLAMGCVPSKSRRAMHSLEGALTWRKELCIRCGKCLKECATKANKFNKDGDYEIFWHHCRMCMHCMMICPTKAITILKQKKELMQEGLARTTMLVLKNFKPADVFHINVLTHITVFCDCWGMTTPAMVPDVGIFGGKDIVAVDHASLEAVKDMKPLPGSVPPPFIVGKGRHLFQKIHQRDPYAQIKALERMGAGSSKYRIVEVK